MKTTLTFAEIQNISQLVRQGLESPPTLDSLKILLANLHILKDPRFNEECCKKLIKLIDSKFSELISDNPHIKNMYDSFNTNLSFSIQDIEDNNRISSNISDIDSYCIIISQIYTHSNYMVANLKEKLHGYFGNNEKAIKDYLSYVKYSSYRRVESYFKYPILIKLDDESIQFLQHIVQDKQNFDFLNYFDKINSLEKNIVQAIINQCTTQDNSLNKKKQIMQLINEKLYKKYEDNSVENDGSVKNLYSIATTYHLSSFAFQKALDFLNNKQLKSKDDLPDITFSFRVNAQDYCFKKLPIQDMRGLILGKLTDCCQSIGDKAEQCVINGMSSEKAGFYIITRAKNDKIVAQSYAWLSQDKDLVLDSFEYSKNISDINLFFQTVVNRLRTELQDHVLLIGTGGNTPKITGTIIAKGPQPDDKNVHNYGDSEYVYWIVRDITPLSEQLNSFDSNNRDVNTDDYRKFEDNHPILKLKSLIKLIPPTTLKYQILHIGQIIKFMNVEDISAICNDSCNMSIFQLVEQYANKVMKLYHKDRAVFNIISANTKAGHLTFVQELMQIYEDDNFDKFKHFIQNVQAILSLYAVGIKIKELWDIYENTYSFCILKKRVNEVKLLIRYGINNEPGTLMRIGKSDSNMLHDLIKATKVLTELHEPCKALQALLKINQNYPSYFRYFVQNIKSIKLLIECDNNLSIEQLEKKYANNPQQIRLFITNAKNVGELCKTGLTIAELLDMYNKDTYKARLFLENGENINILYQLGYYVVGMYHCNINMNKFFIRNGKNIDLLNSAKIISIAELLNMYNKNPNKTEFFIANGENIYKLHEAGLSIKILLDMYDEDQGKTEFFIANGENIYKLHEAGLSIKIFDMYDEDPDKAKFFIENGENIYKLNKAGLSIKIFDMYDEDPDKAKFFIANGENIYKLHEAGLSIKILLDMYDEDPDKAESFIANKESLYWLYDRNIELMKFYQKDPSKTEFFIANGENIYKLHEAGLSIKKLLDMYDEDQGKTEFFIANGENIYKLHEAGLSIKILLDMYDEDQGTTEFFIANGENIYKLHEAGLSIKIFDMYDEDPDKAKFFIANGENIYKLNKAGLSRKKLLDMYDEDPGKTEFFIESGESIYYLYSNRTININNIIAMYEETHPQHLFTEYWHNIYKLHEAGLFMEELLDMYNKDQGKTELFIANGENIYKLHEAGLFMEELLDMYNKDQGKTELFIANGENIYKLHEAGLSIKILLDMYDEDPDKAELLVKNGKNIHYVCLYFKPTINSIMDALVHNPDNIKYLIENAASMYCFGSNATINDMMDMIQAKKEIAKRCMADPLLIENGKNTYKLNKAGLSRKKLLDMYNKDQGKTELFIANGENIYKLHEAGLSIKILLDMYDEDQGKTEFFIKNGENIYKLHEAGLSIKILLDMYDEDQGKTELFIENGDQLFELHEDRFIDVLKLWDMYDAHSDQMKFLIKNGADIRYVCLYSNLTINYILQKYVENSNAVELFIANGENIYKLYEIKYDIQELLNMYCKEDTKKDTNQIKRFIENAQSINDTVHLTNNQILNNYDIPKVGIPYTRLWTSAKRKLEKETGSDTLDITRLIKRAKQDDITESTQSQKMEIESLSSHLDDLNLLGSAVYVDY